MSESTGQRVVHTHCLICEQLCGLEVAVENDRILSIRPDKQNPYTWRDFCVKAQRAGEVMESKWRIRAPMKRIGERWMETSYEDAVGEIAEKVRGIIDRHGPDAVGGYNGNPMGFSFGAISYHFGFLGVIGTKQKFGVQSIDSNAKHVATDGIFGVETLALLPDIDATDYALLIGTNPAVSKFNWGGKVPNGWRRLKDRVSEGAELVVVDPRRSETAAGATRHVAILPETDWAYLLGVIKIILAEKLHRLPAGIPVKGLEALTRIAAAAELGQLAAICDIPVEDITAVARGFAAAKRGFAFAGTGPALGMHGVLTHWLTLVLNVITDRLEQEGGRFAPNWPFNMAMASAKNPAPKLRSRVRGRQSVVGQHSISELADEITTPGQGQIRALFIGGGNPVSTGAGGHRLAEALRELELLVSVDLFQRESHRDAHWLIPAQHFLERAEVHVPLHALNDRPYIQASRQVVPMPEGARPEWMFYRDLAAALGHDLGAMGSPDDISARMLAGSGKISLAEVQAAPHGLAYGERTMGHLWDYFRAAGKTVDLCPANFAEQLQAAIGGAGAVGMPRAGQYRIISRRRNGMMNASLAESSGSVGADETADTVEMNIEDAAAAGIAAGDWLELRSETAAITAQARLSADIRRGIVVLVHGWGSAVFEPGSASEVFRRGNERNKLVSDLDLDPLSSAPRLNGTLVSMKPTQTAGIRYLMDVR